VFADVIPWALARYTDVGSIDEIDDEDVETALLAVGRVALARATHPENVRLKRIAFNEAAQFPEFNVSAESMMWAGRQRAVTELLRRHEELGTIKVDDLELAAEHFLVMARGARAGARRRTCSGYRGDRRAVSGLSRRGGLSAGGDAGQPAWL
jgi:hypothetical protein